VYVSKKNITYSATLAQPLAAFLQGNDSLGLQEEELKLGLSVRLGNALIAAMDAGLRTDSAWFLNANPEAARAFITAYDGQFLNLPAVQNRLRPGTAYLLVVDSLHMSTVLRRSYFTVSNHIVTERRNVLLARLTLRLYDVQARRFTASSTVLYDADRPPPLVPYVNLTNDLSDAASFLNEVFNLGFQQLFAQF
jgi:hypothetical protein